MFGQIRFRITAIILFATFVTLLIVGYLSFNISKTSIYTSNTDIVQERSGESLQMTDEYMKLISLNFKSSGFCEKIAYELMTDKSIGEESAAQAIGYCSSFDEIEEYAVLSLNKSIIFSYVADGKDDLYGSFTLPDFQKYLPAENSIFVFPTEYTKSDFNLVLPLFLNSDICGFQLIRINPDRLNDIIKSQYLSFGTKEWHSFISYDGEFINSDENNIFDAEEYIDELKYTPVLTSDEKFFAVKSQAKCGIGLLTLLSANSYKADVNALQFFLVLISLTFLVIAFVISTLFADGITKPLTELYNKIKSTATPEQK